MAPCRSETVNWCRGNCRRCSTLTIHCREHTAWNCPCSPACNRSGYEAKIELTQTVNGRKRYKGVLEGFEDGEVRIECELDQVGVQVLGFPMMLIREAKLVLTDELIRETLQRTKKLQEGAATAASTEGSTGEKKV